MTQIQPSVVVTGGQANVPSVWREAAFNCLVTSPNGIVSIEDQDRYQVSSDSFKNSTMTWRRNQVTSPYMAGKYTVSAVPDQIIENISVYVLGISQTDLAINLAALIDLFSQPAYELTYSLDEVAYTWECESADYTTDFTNTNVFARQLVVKLQIPRMPAVRIGALYA